MVKKCFYCSCEIADQTVVDMCTRCMHGIWGEKMSQAILDNMTKEKESGNLELGRVSEAAQEKKEEQMEQKIEHLEEELHHLEKEVRRVEDDIEQIEDDVENIEEELHPLQKEQQIKQSFTAMIQDVPEYELETVTNNQTYDPYKERDNDVTRSESNFGL